VLAAIEDYPQLKIKEALQIPDYNSGCYNFCAITINHNQMTGVTTPSMQIFTKTVEAWNSLRDSDKTALRMSGAHKLIILHDPTKATDKGAELVELSDEQKEDIKELHNQDVPIKDIAKQLNLRQKDIKPFLETL